MNRRLTATSLLVCLFWAGGPTFGTDITDTAASVSDSSFRRLDASGDGYLDLDEFVKETADAETARRDFLLFDADGNQRLTWQEFEATRLTNGRRGALPDPLLTIVERAVEALDESYQDWGEHPERKISAQTFVINFVASISQDNARRYDPALRAKCDADGDGNVTRDEARRFLETQLGWRSPSGDPIRRSNGQLLEYTRFTRADLSRDGRLNSQEYQRLWNQSKGDLPFEQVDRDGDKFVSLAEWAQQETNWTDPIEFFRAADKDLDGFLSATELAAATPTAQRWLVPVTLCESDADRDEKLSLAEYRVSMLALPVQTWEVGALDTDRNGRISFAEFTFDSPDFLLLRWLLYHRLDADGDGQLSETEYPFRKVPLETFHLLAADGSEMHLLFSEIDHPICKWPSISPDGRQLLFTSYKESTSESQPRICLLSIDKGDLRVLCEGREASWSRDGEHFCCVRTGDEGGIWIMQSDGTPQRKVADGWGPQWSPDGNSIAFLRERSIWVCDVDSGKLRQILAPEAHPYQGATPYNLRWSPDSTRILFKGGKRRLADLASVSAVGENPDLRVHLSPTSSFDSDAAWSPDGQRILFSMYRSDFRHRVLHQLELGERKKPQIVKGIDPRLTYRGVRFTPDGKWILVGTKESVSDVPQDDRD